MTPLLSRGVMNLNLLRNTQVPRAFLDFLKQVGSEGQNSPGKYILVAAQVDLCCLLHIMYQWYRPPLHGSESRRRTKFILPILADSSSAPPTPTSTTT